MNIILQKENVNVGKTGEDPCLHYTFVHLRTGYAPGFGMTSFLAKLQFVLLIYSAFIISRLISSGEKLPSRQELLFPKRMISEAVLELELHAGAILRLHLQSNPYSP